MQEQSMFLKGTIGYPDDVGLVHPSFHPKQLTEQQFKHVLLKHTADEPTQHHTWQMGWGISTKERSVVLDTETALDKTKPII